MRVSVRAVFAVGSAALACACTGTPSGTLPDDTANASATPSPSTSSLASATPSFSGAAPALGLRPLESRPAELRFREEPELADRSPVTPLVFRFGPAVAASVCKRFEARLREMPRVRLHGDPHIEQYAVTDLGRGLADFDDAAVGPAVIDLTRFATSAELAARAKGLARAEENSLVSELFRGYRDGLKGTRAGKAPAFAATMAQSFKKDRKGFLDGSENAMIAIDQAEEDFIRAEVASYSKLAKLPKRAAGFFTIKKVGLLKLGIGSPVRIFVGSRARRPVGNSCDGVLEFSTL